MSKKNTKYELSLFLKIVGDSSRNRVLEFFIEGRGLDFPLKNIAELIPLNRNTLYKEIEKLVEYNLLINTRKIGSSNFYKLNLSNDMVIYLVKIFDKVIRDELRSMNPKRNLKNDEWEVADKEHNSQYLPNESMNTSKFNLAVA